jgi:hypothetical protein
MWRGLITAYHLLGAGVVVDLHNFTNLDIEVNPILLRNLFWSGTLVTNVLASFAMVWKLLRMSRQLRRSSRVHDGITQRVKKIAMILVESASLYMVLSLIVLVSLNAGPSQNMASTVFQCMSVSKYEKTLHHISLSHYLSSSILQY